MSVRIWKFDRNAVLSRLSGWASRVGENPEVLGVILFGSLARGDATAASDADVLILLRDSSLDFSERLVRFKPIGLGIGVDVFPYTRAEAERALDEGWGTVRVALEEGEILFATAELAGLLEALRPDENGSGNWR